MSPSWRIGEYLVWFKSERDEVNSPHVHVRGEKGAAKFWLDPVELAENHGFNGYELRRAERMVREHEQEFLARWHEYFRFFQP